MDKIWSLPQHLEECISDDEVSIEVIEVFIEFILNEEILTDSNQIKNRS